MTNLNVAFDIFELMSLFHDVESSHNVDKFRNLHPEFKEWSDQDLCTFWQIRTGGQVEINYRDMKDPTKELTVRLTQYLFLKNLIERAPDPSNTTKIFYIKHADN